MPMPTAASKANCDASTDDPKQALLTDLATLIDKFNDLIAMRAAASGFCDLDASTLVPAARLSAALSAIYALTPAADRGVYFTSASAASLFTLTSFARTLLDDTDAATARATLGLETVAQAEAEAGTATTPRAWTAERVKQAAVAASPSAFSETYPRSQHTITLGGPLTIAHGLSTAPTLIVAQLKCIDAGGDAGWAQNDIIECGVSFQQQNSGGGHSIYGDATNINVRMSTGVYQAHNKTTGAPTNLATAKWALLITAYA